MNTTNTTAGVHATAASKAPAGHAGGDLADSRFGYFDSSRDLAAGCEVSVQSLATLPEDCVRELLRMRKGASMH
jgi:hypothetical protein